MLSDLPRLRKYATHRPFGEHLLKKALQTKMNQNQEVESEMMWCNKRLTRNEARNIYTLNS